ncbi:MAG: amidase, partial [Nocardioides sp.]|nr:amidase [Nocardioides sp.]
MTELHDLTALEQGQLLHHCEISPGELAEHYLDRISRLDDVGAFVTVSEQRISTCARELAIKPVGAS